MSTRTPIEERLGAALHARADQVTQEDLTTLLAPARRRSRRAAVVAAGLSAAVVAAVVAVPLVAGDGGAEPRPAPPATDPAPSAPQQQRAEVTVDLDGDGEDDRAWVAGDELHVEVSSGTSFGIPVAPGTRLLPPVTDAGTVNPVLVAVSPVGADQPGTTVIYSGDTLTAADLPDGVDVGPGRTVWVDDGGALMVGEYDARVPEDQRVRVTATSYTRARSGAGLIDAHDAGELCWDRATDPNPVSCDLLPPE